MSYRHNNTAPREGAIRTATAAGVVTVTADLEPGTSSFTVEGLPAYTRETRDRVRAAVLNTGYDWPSGTLTVHVGPYCNAPSPTFDLAAACAVLAAAGRIDQSETDDVVLLGVLGLDGRVIASHETAPAVHNAASIGYRTLIVPEPTAQSAPQMPGVTVIGVKSLRQAVAFLNGEPMPEK